MLTWKALTVVAVAAALKVKIAKLKKENTIKKHSWERKIFQNFIQKILIYNLIPVHTLL